jgi:hypothetical protein
MKMTKKVATTNSANVPKTVPTILSDDEPLLCKLCDEWLLELEPELELLLELLVSLPEEVVVLPIVSEPFVSEPLVSEPLIVPGVSVVLTPPNASEVPLSPLLPGLLEVPLPDEDVPPPLPCPPLDGGGG